jgi:hypothetical protein
VPSAKEQNVEELLAEDHKGLDELLHALITDFHLSDASTTFARLDLFWARLAMHIRAEHLHLFPSILNALDANLSVQENKMFNPVEAVDTLNRLRRDHDFFMHELANAVNVMRGCLVTNHRPGRTERRQEVWPIINRVSERLKSHNKLEEDLVYSLPERLLSVAKQSELVAGVRRELENLPPRFGAGWQRSNGS